MVTEGLSHLPRPTAITHNDNDDDLSNGPRTRVYLRKKQKTKIVLLGKFWQYCSGLGNTSLKIRSTGSASSESEEKATVESESVGKGPQKASDSKTKKRNYQEATFKKRPGLVREYH